MNVRRSLSLFAVLSLLGSFSSSSLCTGQTSAAPAQVSSVLAKSQIYHIELDAERECQFGDCPLHISDKDLSVSQNGRQYPVRVSQPLNANQRAASSFPTHLLVIFSPGASRFKDSKLVKRLSKVLSHGWLVSVNRSDGSFTPYSNAATLADAMAATSGVPLSAEQADRAARQAVATLEQFPGRRILVVDSVGAHSMTVPEPFGLDAKDFAKQYIVDGGEGGTEYRDESWGGFTRGPSPVGGSLYTKRVRVVERAVAHEVKLSGAVKDALKDERYSFDLSFEIPASQADPGSSITLTLPSGSGLYPEHSDLYTVTEQIEDGKTVAIRTTPPQKLIVRQD